MGRIEDALRQAKASHLNDTSDQPARDAAGRAQKLNRTGSTHAPRRSTAIFDELWRGASSYELDPVSLQRARVISDQQPLAVKAAYKMLRTRLLQRMRANRWSKLGITSARAGAGKTLTAINTAISIAREPNQKVILVDLDLRRPSITRYLDIEPRYDLSDYLLNDVEIEDVVIKTAVERFLIIPSVTAHENSSELLSSPRMQDLVRLLSTDIEGCTVIFDFPPMLDADDMLSFSPNIDALLFVVAECETRRPDLQQAQGIIKDLNVVGIVLNKSDDKSPAYY
jgi:capsular exopolysaccharide synthesis family protein